MSDHAKLPAEIRGYAAYLGIAVVLTRDEEKKARMMRVMNALAELAEALEQLNSDGGAA